MKMTMKKINDRVYEFFNLDYDDYIREDVKEDVTEDDIDYSMYEYYFSEDDCLLLEEYRNTPTNTSSKNESAVMSIKDNDVSVIIKPKSKKDELLESLDYLKSKQFKTKQDRESIYTLEMILKNMK
jgi:hypothetical protein